MFKLYFLDSLKLGKAMFLVNELWAAVMFVTSEQGHLIDNSKSSRALFPLAVLEVVAA